MNGDLRALDPIFKIYGQRLAFSGPIVTVKVFEDNVLVRQLLETEGNGRVLVIDGGGSTRCALVGGNLAQWAHDMAWAGIIVNGCIRDVDEINACDIGVRALGSNPLKSNKKAVGEKHVPVQIAGTLIHDGEWLYADSDGILISKTQLSSFHFYPLRFVFASIFIHIPDPLYDCRSFIMSFIHKQSSCRSC